MHQMLHSSCTYDNGDLLVRLREGIRGGAMSWADDESPVQGCAQAGDMSMPPQGAFVSGDVEPVGEVAAWQDGALGDHGHPVRPAVEPLLHSMPAMQQQPNSETKWDLRLNPNSS